jgi:toxin ParE1/3/4
MAEHPRVDRPGRIEGTRELVFPGTPYIVAYRVAASEVIVLRILHSAQQWPTRL